MHTFQETMAKVLHAIGRYDYKQTPLSPERASEYSFDEALSILGTHRRSSLMQPWAGGWAPYERLHHDTDYYVMRPRHIYYSEPGRLGYADLWLSFSSRSNDFTGGSQSYDTWRYLQEQAALTGGEVKIERYTGISLPRVGNSGLRCTSRLIGHILWLSSSTRQQPLCSRMAKMQCRVRRPQEEPGDSWPTDFQPGASYRASHNDPRSLRSNENEWVWTLRGQRGVSRLLREWVGIPEGYVEADQATADASRDCDWGGWDRATKKHTIDYTYEPSFLQECFTSFDGAHGYDGEFWTPLYKIAQEQRGDDWHRCGTSGSDFFDAVNSFIRCNFIHWLMEERRNSQYVLPQEAMFESGWELTSAEAGEWSHRNTEMV